MTFPAIAMDPVAAFAITRLRPQAAEFVLRTIQSTLGWDGVIGHPVSITLLEGDMAGVPGKATLTLSGDGTSLAGKIRAWAVKITADSFTIYGKDLIEAAAPKAVKGAPATDVHVHPCLAGRLVAGVSRGEEHLTVSMTPVADVAYAEAHAKGVAWTWEEATAIVEKALAGRAVDPVLVRSLEMIGLPERAMLLAHVVAAKGKPVETAIGTVKLVAGKRFDFACISCNGDLVVRYSTGEARISEVVPGNWDARIEPKRRTLGQDAALVVGLPALAGLIVAKASEKRGEIREMVLKLAPAPANAADAPAEGQESAAAA